MKWYEDPVYIKMSKKAEEIQEQKKCKEGDVFYSPFYKKTYIWIQGYSGYKDIWLPRQDQLQEMLHTEDDYSYVVSTQLHQINEFYNTIDWVADGSELTMEQVWLAFVMKEKHNKVWDGEDWVKGESK